MTLSRSVTVVVAIAVSVGVALTAVASLLVVRSELFRQVDGQLRRQGDAVTAIVKTSRAARGGLSLPRFDPSRLPRLAPNEGGPLGYVQLIRRTGHGAAPQPLSGSGVQLPITAIDRAVATGTSGEVLRTATVNGDRFRVLTAPVGTTGAIQIGTPLAGIETVVRRLSLILLGICAGGLALAITMSRVVTRRITAPVRQLAAAAEHVAETDNLELRIDASRDDELGQLARRFNAMLDRLQASRQQLAGSVAAQRQLVADASHELRTPITSLRTDLEVLLEGGDLEATTREDILTALVDQIEELGALVADIIDLARGGITQLLEFQKKAVRV